MASIAGASKDWFRNTEWNPEIEAKFFEKLRRARDKAQYLKLQASCLAKSHPRVALMLLSRFFELGETFFLADAFVAAANAHLALGQIEDAVDSYRMALEKERLVPNHRTTAWSEFAMLIADRRLEAYFDEVLRVLAENQSDLIFPNQLFAWHGAFALIQAARGDKADAKERAIKALSAAKMGHSGFRHHPSAGLVGTGHQGFKRKLRGLARPKLWEAIFSRK